MPDTAQSCIHHESHVGRIARNEKDIQDVFKLIEKTQEEILKNKMDIFKIVTLLTSLGVIGNYLIQFIGK